MKWSDGYSINLKGRPRAEVHVLPDPARLQIPLAAGRLHYTTVCVKDGQEAAQGSVLATDPLNYYVPLIAPRSGLVSLAFQGTIVIDNIKPISDSPLDHESEFSHIPRTIDASGKIKYKLLKKGAWHYFTDALTGRLPDPLKVPQAIIVSTTHLEPFHARGDVLLRDRLDHFTRGLEHLQTMLEYQPIYLVFPRVESPFAKTVRDAVRGYAWVRLFEIPLIYPYDDFKLLARKIGLSSSPEKGNVWGLRTEGVLAVETVLTSGLAVTDRTIAVGGSGAAKPAHFRVPAGYPIDALLAQTKCSAGSRIIRSGIFTGESLGPESRGLDNETSGITALPDASPRELLKFLRPGIERRSYSRSFLSALRPSFFETATTSLCGEERACISCGFCADICPARIVPSAIFKLMYQDNIDEAALFRPDLCIGCGLCSYVCPSKIDLTREIALVQKQLREDLNPQKSIASS